MTYVRTVGDLIAALEEMPRDAVVRTYPRDAQSRTPQPKLSEGYESSWGYVLGMDYYGGREAKSKGKTFPVVWL